MIETDKMMEYRMDLSGKRLLILGGQEVHCKVVEAAKALGIYTIVTDYLVGSPAKLIADESLMLSILDAEAIIDWCKRNPVDGVINYCNDPAQKPYQRICEALGLPCYGTKEQFEILTDKTRFKQACTRYGVDVIEEYHENDIGQGRVKYPVLVKPSDSRGSRGQTICRCREEVGKALEIARNESNTGTAIIERFMGGHQDFVAAYFVVDGTPFLIRVDDRYTGSIDENLNRQCIASIAPSRYTSLYVANVNDRVVNMIKALEIQNGPVYMQGFVDGKTVRFYDPGFRFPGGEYELLLRRAVGIDIVKAMVRFAMIGKTGFTNELDHIYRLNGRHAVQLPIAGLPGKIAKFAGIEDISHMRDVVVASQYYREGETIPATGDVKQRIARVSLVTDVDRSVKESISQVLSMLQVENEAGESLLATMVSASDLSDY